MKHLIQQLLANKARRFLVEHKPIVIAITGSVGKTSTRHAIACVLSAKFRVATSIENYNNEFGLPLSILQAKSPGKNPFGWLGVLLSSPKPADVYVLEYGIDHPGDMDYLLSIARPSIAVMTALSPVHVEFFKSIEELGEEKAKAIAAVPSNGLVVLNADDARVVGFGAHSIAPIITYGFRETADVRATDYSVETKSDFSFQPDETFSKIHFIARVTPPLNSGEGMGGDALELSLTNQLGKSAVSSVLAAIAIAKHLGLSNDEIVSKLDRIKHEPGRMNPIAGIKGSLILDSSYNAAPASMMSALNVLAEFSPVENARRIAVFGYMAELGNQTESEHRMIGMRAAEIADRIITVGEIAHHIRHGALDAGFSEDHIEQFETPEEAGRWLDANVKKGDIVLVKGSQSARMEKVVKDIMAEPLRAEDLLVRQTGKWIAS